MSTGAAAVFGLLLVSTTLVSTALIVLLVFTRPTQYTAASLGSLFEKDFKDQDRHNAQQSGSAYCRKHRNENGSLPHKSSVQVVVLGDVGRSPRMQYHALSLAACGVGVQLVGYLDSDPHPDIVASRFIDIVPFTGVPRYFQTSSRWLFLLTAPLKVLYQVVELYRVLAYQTTASQYMLVQNPPSIPLLAIVSLVCFLRRTKLVVDWHNFGYTILALRLGPNHPLVMISKLYERVFAHAADAHLAVTDAMRKVLRANFGVKATTLHDRPAEQFRPFTPDEQSTFWETCDVTQPYASDLQAGKCKVLVSPTSWTADEDFELLLQALVAYSSNKAGNKSLPELLVVITGKGPLKEHFAGRIRTLDTAGKLKHVKICQSWLTIADYAALLASAHLGISLHTSSSGVDLPMKVLDMFGSGLPAAGWSRYEAWPELVHEGVNGLGFGSAEQLTQVLMDVFSDDCKLLGSLRNGAYAEGKRRWHEEWMSAAAKVFQL